MAQQFITIKGVDHLGSGTPDNDTLCGKDIPYGSAWGYTEREGLTEPCPKCFPDTAKPKGKSKAAG